MGANPSTHSQGTQTPRLTTPQSHSQLALHLASGNRSRSGKIAKQL